MWISEILEKLKRDLEGAYHLNGKSYDDVYLSVGDSTITVYDEPCGVVLLEDIMEW